MLRCSKSRTVHGGRLWLPLTVIIATGCGTAQRKDLPLQAPPVSPKVSYRTGAPLGSATTRPSQAVVAGDALAVRAKWIALSGAVRTYRPILTDASLVAAPRSTEPFLAAGRLSRGVQIVPQANVDAFLADVGRGRFGRRAAIATNDAALPRGVTATFALADDRRRIEVALYRSTAKAKSSDTIQVSLIIENTGAQHEHVSLIPKLMPPPARFALILPSHYRGSQVKTIVAIVEVASPSDSMAHWQAVMKCRQQLGQLAAASRPAQTQPSVASSGWAGIAAALRAMNQPTTTRVAMVYLAGETGAGLFGDAALIARPPILAELSGRIRKRLGKPPNAMAPAHLGWILDVVTLEQMAALHSTKKMPPELTGVLARYAGEAARNAGSLEELLRAQGREQLRARLIAENFMYLGDASPSARVRAYDWLKSRGRAPTNYDPLAPPKERSAALDAALTAASSSAAAQTGKTVGGGS